MVFNYNPIDYVGAMTPGGSEYGKTGTVNKQFFNSSSGTDWRDSTAFAYSQLAQREANALNIALMNYQNEYNSPYNQMKMYQMAGVSPYEALGHFVQGASPSAPGAASGQSHRGANVIKQLDTVSGLIGSLVGVFRGAKDIQESVQQMQYNDLAFPIMYDTLVQRDNMYSEQYKLQSLDNIKKGIELGLIDSPQYGWLTNESLQGIKDSPYYQGLLLLNELRSTQKSHTAELTESEKKRQAELTQRVQNLARQYDLIGYDKLETGNEILDWLSNIMSQLVVRVGSSNPLQIQ